MKEIKKREKAIEGNWRERKRKRGKGYKRYRKQ